MRWTAVWLDRSLGTAILRQRLRFTNQLLGIGLRGLCGTNRLVDVTARGFHVHKQLFAEFLECVTSHYWRYLGSDRVFAPYRQGVGKRICSKFEITSANSAWRTIAAIQSAMRKTLIEASRGQLRFGKETLEPSSQSLFVIF